MLQSPAPDTTAIAGEAEEDCGSLYVAVELFYRLEDHKEAKKGVKVEVIKCGKIQYLSLTYKKIK